MDQKSLIPLFELGFWVPGVFADSVAGVSTIEDLLASKKPEFKNNLQGYYETISSEEKFVISGLEPSEKVNVMEKVFLDLEIESSSRDVIGTAIHLLHSPYINKLLLNSNLDIFSEDFVWIKLTEEKTTLKPGKSYLVGTITKKIWNYDEAKFDLKVKIFPSNLDRSVRFPDQICEVGNNLEVRFAVMNMMGRTVKKAKLGSAGFLFGFLHYVSKDDSGKDTLNESGNISEFENYYNKRFGKGFQGFTAEYMQYKRRTNELMSISQCQEYIEYFRKLGFTSMKEIFQQILLSCKKFSNFEEDLFKHLQALLCNDVPNPAEVANILFSSLYAQFILTQEQKEKFPCFEDLRAKLFPKNWTYKGEIDGFLLENSFCYTNQQTYEHPKKKKNISRKEKKKNKMTNLNMMLIEKDNEVMEVIENEMEVEEIDIKSEVVDSDDDIEVIEEIIKAPTQDLFPSEEEVEVPTPGIEMFPEPVACSSISHIV